MVSTRASSGVTQSRVTSGSPSPEFDTVSQ
jgi:hypothetical protein